MPVISGALAGIALSYRKGWSGDSLEQAIVTSRRRDLEKGATNPGPHKADLHLSLDGAAAKERLSRGEQKAMTAALVLAQANTMCANGEKPVLRLDDLFSEFDQKHLERVLDAALELRVQVWLTGTRVPSSVKQRNGSCTMFHVEHGRVENQAV